MTARRIVEIDPERPNPRLLRAAYADVLEPSFPPSELAPFDAFALAYAPGSDPGGTVVVAVDREEVVGVAVEQQYHASRIGLLGYLATRPDARDGGVGSELIAALLRRWTAQPIDVVIGEVEDPQVHPATADDRTHARLRFYERHGADVLAVPWIQPGLDGGPRVPGFLLLRFWYRPAAGVLRAAELGEWADEYYRDEEGVIPNDDEFRALRAELVRADPVPIVPIASPDAASVD